MNPYYSESSFRVRITKIDEYDDMEFDWHDDILYSGRSLDTFIGDPIQMHTMWKIDIVELATDVVAATVDNLESREKAEEISADIRADLLVLSVIEFVIKYCPGFHRTVS
ncbi:MAG: hypothetical protein JJE36_06295 [Coriobacteriia bacterium]|nr:hypothetical protein [Coriobacteriia bacterium]